MDDSVSNLPAATVQPCRECPWQRRSAPGWLGPHTAEEWVQGAHGESAIACHMTIKTEDPDADEGDWSSPDIRQCAGAAIYRANVCKLPINKQIAVGPRNTEYVFATPSEFLGHHS